VSTKLQGGAGTALMLLGVGVMILGIYDVATTSFVEANIPILAASSPPSRI
jgi:hypothetical protein